jgi:hypothetical protein
LSTANQPSERDDTARQALRLDLLNIALRYEQKTSAIYRAALLLLQAEASSGANEELREAFENLADRLEPSQLTPDNYFAGLLLVSAISETEMYFVDVLRRIVVEFPKKLGSTTFRLADILDKSRDELVLLAAEESLNRLMYKKPSEYLADLGDLLSIDTVPLKTAWPSFVEAKARRDLGIHNAWRVNATYRRKIAEADLPDSPPDEALMCPDYEYVRACVNNCDFIVRSIRSQLDVLHS